MGRDTADHDIGALQLTTLELIYLNTIVNGKLSPKYAGELLELPPSRRSTLLQQAKRRNRIAKTDWLVHSFRMYEKGVWDWDFLPTDDPPHIRLQRNY